VEFIPVIVSTQFSRALSDYGAIRSADEIDNVVNRAR